MFAGALELVELPASVNLLDELRSNSAVLAHVVGGLAVTILGLRLLRRYRYELSGFPPVCPAPDAVEIS